jgi:two-component system KDP operon response regulator KdpE
MTGGTSRVLVCDDEPHIVRALKLILREAGFEVVQAGSVAEALERAPLHPLDAAIVDLVLPDGDGVEVCQGLREWSEMPILLLSAVGDEDQKVRALEAGADDYVTKPFSPRELVARVHAVLRRTPAAADEPLVSIGGLEVDLARREVRRDGDDVHLSPIEFDLLRVLVRNRGRLLTHRVLLTEVWGHSYGEDVATLRTSIGRLRRKIEPAEGDGPRLIRTDLGVGYRFSA